LIVFLSASAAGAEAEEERIRELLTVTGIEARARQLPELLSSQVTASMGGDTGKGSAHLTRLLVEDLRTEAVVQAMVDAVLAGLDGASVETLLAWYAAEPGARVAQAIALANSRTGDSIFDAYARRIQGQPPTAMRLQAAVAVDEATGLSRHLTRIVVGANLIVTHEMDRIFAVDRIGEEQRKLLRRAIQKQVQESVLQQTRTYALFSMRTLRSAELNQYVEHSQSEGAKAFHEIAFGAYDKAAAKAMAGFQEKVETWIEKDRDPTVYRAAAREEGTAWGKSRLDQQCLEESLRRDRRCSDLICEAGLADFYAGCLSSARPAPNFCNGVPAFEGADGARWRARRCRVVGRSDRVCRNLMASAQHHCQAAAAPEN
jgi:hypothetical protein